MTSSIFCCAILSLQFAHSLACLLEDGRSSIYLSVFEDLKPGEVVGKLPIIGTVSGEKPDTFLNLVKGNDLVEIRPGTKELRLKGHLDRDEGLGKFEAVVECKTTKADSDFSQLNISTFVTVKDVNDNAPEFDEDEYDISIAEELPVGTIVFTDFEATDKDQPGPNSFVQYSIVPGENSNLLEIVDPFKPVVTVKNRIDYERLHEFQVFLEAKDQGEPPKSTKVPLRVKVENQNDLPPRFGHNIYYVHRIENKELKTEPEAISARDGDALNATIEYSLQGEDAKMFSIDKSGRIRTNTVPPPRKATLLVHAYEKANREKNTTATVVVDLADGLRFEHQSYSIQIAPNIVPDVVMMTVKAVSEKPSATVSYSLKGPSDALSIDKASGSISSKGIPGNVSLLHYNITATDGEQVATVPLEVHISSTASSPSTFAFNQTEYRFKASDSLPVIGVVKVLQGTPTYSLANMNRDFSIDSQGLIKVKHGGNPSCSQCELVVIAKSETEEIAMAQVIIEYSGEAPPTEAMLTVFILVLIGVIVALVVAIICRKVHYQWREKKRANICWLNTSQSTSETGVSITGTMPPQSRYVVTSEKERAFSPPSQGIPCGTQEVKSPPTSHTKSPTPRRAQGAHLVPVTVTNHDGAPTVYF